MNWKLLTAIVVTVMYCAAVKVEAATLTVSIDGESADVPLRFVEFTDRPGGYYEVDTEDGEPFNFLTQDGGISLGGTLDPDPSLLFGSVAFDFGLPSSFGYIFTLPLSPTVTNPSFVNDSFSGSVTNGSAAGGVTVTALAPPPGIPVDGDGITEMEVFTLSDDFGATWKNVGLDLGLSEFVPLAPFASGLTGTYNEGPIATIAGGPWTDMRADVNFRLSGGTDIFTFNGAKILEPASSTVPEPSTICLAFLLLGCVLSIRRVAIRS